MTRVFQHSSLALLVACALAGCAGTSTGNPANSGNDKDPDAGKPGNGTGNGGEAAYGNCENKPKDLATLDTKSELGFSGRDVLANAVGEHELPMRWLASEWLEVSPAAGTDNLRITVTAKGDEARFIDSSPKQNNGGIELATPDCPDRVEVDVRVTLKSDDGGLDESFDATLSAVDTRVSSYYASIEADDIGGSLSVQGKGSQANFELDAIVIQARFSKLGLAGSITPALSSKDSDDDNASGTGNGGVAAVGGLIARWPADDACTDSFSFEGFTVQLDDTFGDSSVQQAITHVNDASPLALTWKNGDEADLEISFEPNTQSACASYGIGSFGGANEEPQLHVNGKLHAKSSDARIDGEWPVVLRAFFAHEASGDTLREIRVESSGLGQGLVESAKFEDTFGISGVDVSEYDSANVLVTLAWTAAGDFEIVAPASSVKIQGANVPECAMPEPEPTPGEGSGGGASGGSAGCQGIDFEDVEVLDLTNK